MAKKKEKEKDDFFAGLAKQVGGNVLKGRGKSKYLIDFGNLALNYLCTGKYMGGGIPTGITEIYGPSQSAKSLLAMTLIGRCQKMGGYCILLDFERAANEHFAETAGHVDASKVIVLTPLSIEECQQKIMAITKKIREAKGPDVPILFIWDSIGVAMCAREAREANLPPNYTAAQYKAMVGGKEQPGERAKAAGTFLRKVNPFLDEHHAALFVINQIRYKIGVMFGNPETTAGGGNGLPFYANTRLRSSAQKKIFDKKLGVSIGVNLKFVNTKSRCFDPYLQTEGVKLYFRKGINPLGGLLTTLIGAGRIEDAGKSMWKVNEPWAEGKEITFKASKVENSIDPEVLYKCPQLVDATSAEEIKEYIGIFAETLDIDKSGDIEEQDTGVDDSEEGDGLEEDIDAAIGGEESDE